MYKNVTVYGAMILLAFLCVFPYAQFYLQNGHMTLICFVYQYARKTKDYTGKISQEHVFPLVQKILPIATIPTLITEQEDAYKCVRKALFQTTKNECAGITLKIALMDGQMTTITAVLIYVQDPILGIHTVIM